MTMIAKDLSGLALAAVRADGWVDVARAAVPGSLADWLDRLLADAADEGLELTWTLRVDTLTLVDIEA